MASGKLNSLSVERAHRFGGPVLLLSDGDGLYFRKQSREGVAWMFRYRFAGRERWMTLGNFPDMTLAAARIEAREKRLLLDKRRDPRQRLLHLGIDTLNAALAAVEHGLEHFTLHDLRRTMRTHLASLGIRSEVAERCLGHKLRGVEGTYNTHDYLNERRAALETWTALLLDIESGAQKVTPIRRKAAR
jgi:integrase